MTTVATLDVLIGVNSRELDRELGRAERSIHNFGRDAGRSIAGVGAALTGMSAPIIAFRATGIRVASDFEGAMAEISARTGIVGDDLQDISDYALQMGADTAFSGQQAADAMLQLLTSGQNAEQAMATLPAVLNLAAAGGLELGRSADLVTDIMAQFGLEVDEAGTVTDALARAAGSSSATVDDLAQAFSNVGGVANNFGLDVETTAAALAVFSENGIKGAEAGTQLRSMLLNMTRTTLPVREAWSELGTSFYDSEGNIRDLNTVIAELDTALDGLPVEEQNRLMMQLGGSYGIVGLTALRGSISIDEMKESMSDATGAADVAQSRMNTFAGRMDSLRGSIETLQIRALTPLLQNGLSPLIAIATTAINKIVDFTIAAPGLTQAFVNMGIAVAAVGPALLTIGGAFALLGGGAILTAVAVGGVAAAIVGLITVAQNLDQIKAEISSFKIGERSVGEISAQVRGQLTDALNRIEIESAQLGQFAQRMANAIGGAFGNVSTQIRASVIGALNNVEINAPDFGQLSQRVSSAIGDSFSGNMDMQQIGGWADRNMNAIVETVVAVAGIVLGGPIGLAIGGARLVASAIENDFLGIGTFIRDSGIAGSVESAFADLKTTIDGIISGVFGGGASTATGAEFFDMTSTLGGVDTGGSDALSKFASDIQMAVGAILNIGSQIGGDIIAGFRDLGAGIGDFIAGITGSETAGLYDAVRPIIGAIGGIALAIGRLVGFATGTTLSAIGDALGPIGEGIGDFITTISRLGQGDIGGALESLGGGLLNIAEGLVSFPIGVVDGIISKLNEIFGIDIPNIGEILAGFGSAFQTAWDSLQVIIDNVKRSLDRFALDVQFRIIDFIAGIRNTIYDMTKGTIAEIDIAPEINLQRQTLDDQLWVIDEVIPWLESSLQQQIANQDINIDVGTANFVAAGNADMIARGLTFQGRNSVAEAINIALAQGDVEAVQVLEPIAVAAGIDIDEEAIDLMMRQQVTETVDAVDDLTTTTPIDTTIETDGLAIIGQFTEQVTAATDGTEVAATVSVTVSPMVANMAEVQSAIAAQIAAGIGSGGAGGGSTTQERIDGSHAGGLAYVPFNGYLARLHAGERVLTADENRAYAAGMMATSGAGGASANINVVAYDKWEVTKMVQQALREMGVKVGG